MTRPAQLNNFVLTECLNLEIVLCVIHMMPVTTQLRLAMERIQLENSQALFSYLFPVYDKQ